LFDPFGSTTDPDAMSSQENDLYLDHAATTPLREEVAEAMGEGHQLRDEKRRQQPELKELDQRGSYGN